MQVPNADAATIDPRKLRDYLLSLSHPVGRFKARFFHALGFSTDDWQRLDAAFRSQHLTQHADPVRVSRHGTTYLIRAILVGPNGQSSLAVSVWFIPSGSVTPRFITAYPGDAP